MIQTDFIIVGQGIAGTLLSHKLMDLGKRVIVIDKSSPNTSSLVAGAVLNPMAGKHWSPAPQAHLFLPKAVETYVEIGKQLNITILQKATLSVFHEDEERKIHFENQAVLFPQYLKTDVTVNSDIFNPDFGQGIIEGLYLIDASLLLNKWMQFLLSRNAFLEDDFDWEQMEILNDRIVFQNIEAEKIIFCTGAEAVSQPFFQHLPFTRNRGEALIISIPQLPEDTIYHKHLRLVPKGNGLFWCGSNYIWNAENLIPDEKWRDEAETELKLWLNVPFDIKGHLVANRPTTAGQIPFIGLHPKQNTLGIFNGLGTRGFSSGPFWAEEFARQLIDSQYKIPNYNQEWFCKKF